MDRRSLGHSWQAFAGFAQWRFDLEHADTVWPAPGAGYVIVDRYLDTVENYSDTRLKPLRKANNQGRARGLCMADALLAEPLTISRLIRLAAPASVDAQLGRRLCRAAPQDAPELPRRYIESLYAWLRQLQGALAGARETDQTRGLRFTSGGDCAFGSDGSASLVATVMVAAAANELVERLPAMLAAAEARLRASHETLRGWLVTQETVDVLLSRLLAVDQRVVELSGLPRITGRFYTADETALVSLPVSVRREIISGHPDKRLCQRLGASGLKISVRITKPSRSVGATAACACSASPNRSRLGAWPFLEL